MAEFNMVEPCLAAQRRNVFICPACGGVLNADDGHREIKCSGCNRFFGYEKEIPLLFLSNEWKESGADVTETIKSFYEKTPFPNYEDLDSGQSLREKARKGLFARLLDSQTPYNANILEAGCGTGQLSNFLGMAKGRSVFGADMCLNSLKLGQEFKEKNQINNVTFLQMNLFKPVFRPDSFDLVICSGVLHHTSNPFLGFQSIAKLVRKGGFVVVGLYNTYGRISTDIRRFLFRISGDRFKFFDSRLRDRGVGDIRKRTWFMDQYKNPHESKHTIGEVLNWFEQSGFEFVNSIPKSTEEPFSSDEKLFKTNPKGTMLDHFFIQSGMMFSGGREGGFFVMIGQKKF